MSARLRNLLVSLVAAAVASLVSPPAAMADDPHNCPASTSWDGILRRCV